MAGNTPINVLSKKTLKFFERFADDFRIAVTHWKVCSLGEWKKGFMGERNKFSKGVAAAPRSGGSFFSFVERSSHLPRITHGDPDGVGGILGPGIQSLSGCCPASSGQQFFYYSKHG
jgi:hypothetical protein